MTNLTKVEYRVRSSERFFVTRYEEGVDERGATFGGVGGPDGEYASADTAYEVAYALAKTEHERLGWPVDDPRIQYPRRIDVAASQVVG